MDINDLPDPNTFKYKWRSPYDYNNTFTRPHIYALTYKGIIKYIGKSKGTKNNYYTGGVIPNKINDIGIKGVLEFVPEEKLDEAEIFWIDKVKPKFNIAKGGQGGLSGECNPAKRPEVREKIGNSSRNRKPSKESREKMRQAKLKNPVKAHLNTKRSELTKQKIKESHKKRNETKHNKIKELIKKGYYNSEIVKKLRTSSATVTKIKKELNLTAVHNRSSLAPNPDNLT